ncbi:nucleotidyltransferase family protein [Alkalihalobacterium alkalinitrilicum]|uniref:nucleotidyltransferase family protein n=1 Tax=Alkalihalobacterium alkalinitrilicum TaxID=427920 RepID=UPI000995BEC0|nr:nucleotidyltransferase family protein [Alkalihalobacterium alkalinitrilicum]
MLKIGAVILAAGMSKRMGAPKLLLNFHGKPLFLHSVECAISSKLSPILIVGGKHIQSLQHYTRDLPVEVISNPNYEEGMATSFKLGVEAIGDKVDAIMVLLADQPFLPPMLIERIVQTYLHSRSEGTRIVRPRYSSLPGHPVLFDADLFTEFQGLKGDEGGRSIIKKHSQKLKLIDVENLMWGVDIDTPNELKKYENSPHFCI